jgi:membrane protease YdiL (CAAX protease family)
MDSAAPASGHPCEPWKFWAGLAWSVVIWGSWFGAQVVMAALVFGLLGSDANQAVVIGVITIGSAPVLLAVLAVAVRASGCGFADYLALVWPSRRDLLVGFAVIAVLLPLADLATYLSGRAIVPPFVIDSFRAAKEGHALSLIIFAFVVVAPVTEELGIRGFLLRGWAASPLGVPGAIVLSSVAWAVMHVQYEAFFVVQIVLLGIVFGWLRWRSGSTLLTLFLHALVNGYALVQAAIIVARS